MNLPQTLAAAAVAASLLLTSACGADETSEAADPASAQETPAQEASEPAAPRYEKTAQGASDYLDDLLEVSISEFEAIEDADQPDETTLAAIAAVMPETVAFLEAPDLSPDRAQAFVMQLWVVYAMITGLGGGDLRDLAEEGSADDWKLEGDRAVSVATGDEGNPVTELVYAGNTWSVSPAVAELTDDEVEQMRQGTYAFE